MSKKTLTLASAVICAFLISGCTAFYTPTGFSTPTGGAIYTGSTYGSALPCGPVLPPHKFIKRVTGMSMQTCILGLVSFGDGGLFAAKTDALKELKEADDVINITADTKMYSVLMLFTTVQTVIKGDAIQYQ